MSMPGAWKTANLAVNWRFDGIHSQTSSPMDAGQDSILETPTVGLVGQTFHNLRQFRTSQKQINKNDSKLKNSAENIPKYTKLPQVEQLVLPTIHTTRKLTNSIVFQEMDNNINLCQMIQK